MMEYDKDIVANPMELMDPLDTPPSDPLAWNRPVWLHYTLQDAERYVPSKRTFTKARSHAYIRYKLYL